MIKCRELSSRHYIKITRLKQVHSISSFQSVISREALAPVGCSDGFVAKAVTATGTLRLSGGGLGGRRGAGWERGGAHSPPCGHSKPLAELLVLCDLLGLRGIGKFKQHPSRCIIFSSAPQTVVSLQAERVAFVYEICCLIGPSASHCSLQSRYF